MFLCSIVFLGLAYCGMRGRHIRTTLLLERMPPRVRCGFNIMAALIAMAVFALLAWYGWEEAWESWLVREFDGTQVRVPVYPSRFIVVIGSFSTGDTKGV